MNKKNPLCAEGGESRKPIKVLPRASWSHNGDHHNLLEHNAVEAARHVHSVGERYKYCQLAKSLHILFRHFCGWLCYLEELLVQGFWVIRHLFYL